MITIKVTGVSRLLARQAFIYGAMGNRWEKGLKRAGEHALAESQIFVPVLTGALKETGQTYNAGGKGWRADQVVAYGPVSGNGNFDYTEIQHENLAYSHISPTKAHFLLDAVLGTAGEMVEIIRRNLKFG